MPNLNHLWQRFLLASSLLVGLLIGAAVTVFGYSNLGTVDVHWSILHIDGVPLWTVAVIPIALTVIAGTLYHWMNSFHHFTEHMRHRHRVHELEVEVASLRAHLDHVLDIPDQSTSKIAPKHTVAAPELDERITELSPAHTAALPEPSNDEPKPSQSRGRRRATLAEATTEPSAAEPAGASAPGEDGTSQPEGVKEAIGAGSEAGKAAGKSS